MTLELEYETVRDALEKAIAKKGAGFVYCPPIGSGSECSYADGEGAPSCLVGHAIYSLSPETFAELREFEADPECDDSSVSGIASEGFISGSPELIRALFWAQSEQDGGRTWGEALAQFESVYANGIRE